MQISEAIVALLQEFGLLGGLFVVFFFGMHIWVYRAYERHAVAMERQADKRVGEQERENIRVIQENQEYRTRFMRFIDDKMGADQ